MNNKRETRTKKSRKRTHLQVGPQTVEELLKYQDEHMKPMYGFSHETWGRVTARLRLAAESGLHCLVYGETGTGKELIVGQLAKMAGEI